MSSYPFTLRDAAGDLMYVEADTIKDTTNIIVEAMAFLHTGTHCKQTGYTQVIFQIDSLLLKKY